MWDETMRVGLIALAALAPAAMSSAAAASPRFAGPPQSLAAAAALPPASLAAAAPPAPSPAASAHGLAVVALSAAADAAWPLAQAVYSDPTLRPGGLSEPEARILCGEPLPADAPPPLRDLGQTVAAMHGDDAPTRVLLTELAHRYSLRALVTVWADSGGHPIAHVFLAESGAFDAALYAPDEGAAVSWTGAVRSLARAFAPAPTPGPAPLLATHEAKGKERGAAASHFYESPWFWGGIGAAAAAAAAIYLSTRDSSSPTIHLEVQVPH